MPAQTVDEDAVNVRVGKGFTVIVIVWLFIQPTALVAFTV